METENNRLAAVDTDMRNILPLLKSVVREKSDIVYTGEGDEFKVILPHMEGSAHHVPLKRLKDRLSEFFTEFKGSSGLGKGFDINVAAVNVLLSETDFAYMDEADRARYLRIEKTGNRFAVFHGTLNFSGK